MNYVSIALAVVGLVGCKQGVTDANDIPDGASTGNLVVNLGGDSDRAGSADELNSSVDEVWIRFEDVQVHHESKGWISIAPERKDVDLVALRAGDSEQIGRADVYEGAYDTLRLLMTDAWIVVDGEELDLAIADGIEIPDEGIDFSESFFVDANTTTSLWVGWDLDTQLNDNGGAWSLGTDANLDVVLD